MASFELPNVEGLTSIDELKNAVGKMTKELSWLLNNIDWKNINELNIEMNGGAYVRVNNDGIAISDGTAVTFKADVDGKVTMTGATIQSKDGGYPRVEMNPEQNMFAAYSAENNYLTIQALEGQNQSPQMTIKSPSGNLTAFISGLAAYLAVTGTDFYLSTDRNIVLSPGSIQYNVIVPFDQVKDPNTGKFLYQELAGKANVSEAGYNLIFDNTTRNLKMYNKSGGLLAQVNIPN